MEEQQQNGRPPQILLPRRPNPTRQRGSPLARTRPIQKQSQQDHCSEIQVRPLPAHMQIGTTTSGYSIASVGSSISPWGREGSSRTLPPVLPSLVLCRYKQLRSHIRIRRDPRAQKEYQDVHSTFDKHLTTLRAQLECPLSGRHPSWDTVHEHVLPTSSSLEHCAKPETIQLTERGAEYGLAWRTEGIKASRAVFGQARKDRRLLVLTLSFFLLSTIR